MATSSNIAQVVGWLDSWVHSFDMTRPGKEQSLGRDIAMTIIRGPDVSGQGGIMGRCADGKGPDGTDWPANAPEYAEEKEERYGHSEVNRRTGQMLSQQSLYGRTTIEPEVVTLRYGTGTAPSGSAAPSGYISAQDRAVTDTQKAAWAHQRGASARRRDVRGRFAGGGGGRPARKFYAMADEDRANVVECAQDNLNGYISETNRANGV